MDSTPTFNARLHGGGETLNFKYVSSEGEGGGDYYYVQSGQDTINKLYRHIRNQDPGTYETYRFAMEKYLHWNKDIYVDVGDAMAHNKVKYGLAIYVKDEEDKKQVRDDLKELIERKQVGSGKRRRRTKRRKSNKTRKRKSRRTKKRRNRR